MRTIRHLLAAVLLAVTAALTQAGTVVWKKTPIPLELVVGVEQMVVLPTDAAIGLPPALANTAVFRTLVTGGTAYWTALEAFENQRIKLRLESGEYILFDVSARVEQSPPAASETIQVVLAKGSGATPQNMAHTGSNRQAPATLFELIRYAAQEVYSPARLVAPVPGIRSVPVGLSGNMTALYDQGKHRGLVLLPYKAWSVDGLYVTAFIVTNEHAHEMTLDNRKVRHTPTAQRNGVAPHFVASTFFDTTLAPRGQPGNRTSLFVVTDQPIRSVVRGGF